MTKLDKNIEMPDVNSLFDVWWIKNENLLRFEGCSKTSSFRIWNDAYMAGQNNLIKHASMELLKSDCDAGIPH
jgi:hypothetical protein